MAESVLSPQAGRISVAGRLGRVPGAAWLLAVLCVVYSIAAPGFLSGANLRNVLLQATVLLLLALPMTLIILTEGLDLSMGASLSLCTVVLAVVQIASGSIVLGLAAAMFVALLIGVANGALIAAFDLPPFVVTLGTLGAAQGLALVAAEGRTTMGVSEGLRWFWEGTLLGVAAPLWMAALVWAVIHLLLYHTRFGARVFALGGNREALVFAGISVRWSLLWVYMLGGACVGLAALLMTARVNGGHPTAAIGLEFDAIAAVAVGGTAFERGKGSLTGTVLGVLAVGVMRNGLNLLSMPSSVQVAAVGVVVIAALWVDAARSKS
ncbi:MAG: ABC transporter permease [Bdellovibrionales bacterium]|nr:ABC transporter permease [Ramlibacter sp.]